MKTMRNQSVIERRELSYVDLCQLFEGKILAIRILPFLEEELIEALTERLDLNSHQLKHYSMAQDVGVRRLGMTIYETGSQADKLTRYHQLARGAGERLRSIFFPYQNPLDLLRVRLMEVWPKGVQIEAALGEPMNPGIIRAFEQDDPEGLPPHQDLLSRDLPGNNRANNLKAQLAANVYLQIPSKGGEIDIWDYEPGLEEFEEQKSSRYDFIQRAQLPDNYVRIKPQRGELLLFRSSCVHSVQASYGSSRVAFSCSLGYFGLADPLSLWS